MAVVKSVSFKEKEFDLLDWISDRDFSYYVKDLIKRDMRNEVPNQKDEKKKRNINFDFS